LQPAEVLFDAMRSCAPGVRRVGCVWNPAEPNAEASVKLGRAVCAKLGIELLEANGSNVNEVASAADGVIARGIDCFWILADTNVIAAAKPVIERCRRAGIPVITNFPNMAAMGAAINFGADYHAMGISTGAIAELVLGGCPPRDVPCENFVPISLWLNHDGFGKDWTRQAALEEHAERIYEGTGAPKLRTVEQPVAPDSVLALLAARAKSGAGATPAAQPARMPVISLITYNRSPNFEECYRGFMDELPKLGMVDGTNCRVVLRDAQLDIGTLNTIVTATAEERPDVVVPFTTPALQATIRRIRDRPVVFSLVASGVEAGAGTSNDDHLPNVTGAQTSSDVALMVRILQEALPAARRVGTVFAPGETNSVFNRNELAAELRKAGIELVSAGADRPTELPEAADGVVTQGIQAMVQISDNSSGTGFATIVKAADRAGIPVLAFTPGAMRAGATLAVSRDFEDVGRLSARLAVRVLKGEQTAKIPFTWPDRTELLVNPARMAKYRVVLPAERMKGARTMTESTGARP
jgi:putative ABC transport system substrate-binding protein